MPGTLFVVATPIGNLEDMTHRAVRVLAEASVIAAEDTRRTAVLLRRYGISTPTTSFHEHNERERLPRLIERLESGDSVAIVSDAGTPGISDPGYRLVRAALDHRIHVEAIPGPSAILASLVLSGLPTGRFVFEGFAPPRADPRSAWLQGLAKERRTCVFFEAPHRVRATLAAALDILGDREVAVVRELSKIHEEVLRGPISSVLNQLSAPRGEITVVLAPWSGEDAAGHQPTDHDIFDEFGHMTESTGLGRRQILAALAERFGMPVNAVYAAVERAKKSG
jgi:16S rRNA (cytidine1402-2'-O)-methyltransferase